MIRILLSARDPYIRVSGAVWLTFEDERAGKEALRELQALPGDPGAWAALNLARRGDSAGLRRALTVLSVPGAGGMEGVPHGNLQKRLLVLLSNSAAASGLEFPPETLKPEQRLGEKEHAKLVYRRYLRWYETHQDKLRLRDPWLKELAEQKMD